MFDHLVHTLPAQWLWLIMRKICNLLVYQLLCGKPICACGRNDWNYEPWFISSVHVELTMERTWCTIQTSNHAVPRHCTAVASNSVYHTTSLPDQHFCVFLVTACNIAWLAGYSYFAATLLPFWLPFTLRSYERSFISHKGPIQSELFYLRIFVEGMLVLD